MNQSNVFNRYRGNTRRLRIFTHDFPLIARTRNTVPCSFEVRNGRVQRTARSTELQDRRAVAKADTHRYAVSAQDHARDKFLSRSKSYNNKGVNEATRRVRQAQKARGF